MGYGRLISLWFTEQWKRDFFKTATKLHIAWHRIILRIELLLGELNICKFVACLIKFKTY